MLSTHQFWVGLVVGAVACHFIGKRMAAKAAGG